MHATYEAPVFPVPPPEMHLGTLAGAAILEVELRDRDTVRRKVRALQGRLREIDRLKAKGAETLDPQQREKAAQEAELRWSLAKLEVELEKLEQPDHLVFEIQSAWGCHVLECKVGEPCKDLARRFCKEHGLDIPLAGPLAEKMEQRLAGGFVDEPLPAAPTTTLRKGPKPKVIDLGDKEAVRRRVRALQKKLRDIEKLKTCPEGCVDQLQREKLASEREVRASCAALERELDLLDRLPKMVFDVETEGGVRYIEFREGDDCMALAGKFVDDHGLDEDLIEPLADHMEQKLREQAILNDTEE